MAAANLWPYVRRFGPLALIAIAVVAALASGVTRHLSLHELRERHAMLEALVKAHPVLTLCYLRRGDLFGRRGSLVAGGADHDLDRRPVCSAPRIGVGRGGRSARTVGATIIFLICRTAAGDFAAAQQGRTDRGQDIEGGASPRRLLLHRDLAAG